MHCESISDGQVVLHDHDHKDHANNNAQPSASSKEQLGPVLIVVIFHVQLTHHEPCLAGTYLVMSWRIIVMIVSS